jgi:hypothetical protein
MASPFKRSCPFCQNFKFVEMNEILGHIWQVHAQNTGKSFSESLILASTNPQYDDRLFIELQVQYMKIASSEHVVYTNCFLF